MSSPAGSRQPKGIWHSDFRSDIEGLRAIAVLLVLLYHLRVPGLDGGFLGVDLFFVISGFLITGLLLREGAREGRIHLLRFYARRARRLLPAALLVILVTVLAGWLVLPGSQLRYLAHDGLGATFYVVNWVLAHRAVDYLAEDAEVSPLQHYWSLSIEEQFYLLWPLVVILVLWWALHSPGLQRRGAHARPGALPVTRLRIGLAVALAPVILVSFLWSVHLTRDDPARAYFVSTTRIWQLGVGVALALAFPLLARLTRRTSAVLATTGIALILLSTLVTDAHTPWPGVAAVAPVLGSAAIIAAGCTDQRTLPSRLLGWRPLVWIGGLSYAIYLWHWPVLVLAEAHWGALSWPWRLTLGIAVILLSWGTKHLVEDPVRHHRGLAQRHTRNLVWAACGMVTVSAMVLGLLSTRPSLTDTDKSQVPGPLALVADNDDPPWDPLAVPSSAYTASGPLVPHPDLAPEDNPSYYDDGCQVPQRQAELRHDCVYGDPTSATTVLLLGDSKMGQWFSAVDWIAQQEGWRLQTHLKSACPFTVAGAEHPDCSEHGRAVVDHVQSLPEAPALAVLSTGESHSTELQEGMSQAVRALQQVGTRVVILQDNDYPASSRYPCAAEQPDDLLACSFTPIDRGGHQLLSGVAQDTGADLVDLRRWICPEGTTCPVAIGGQLIYRQGSHLTDTYARALTPVLYQELSQSGLTAASLADISQLVPQLRRQ